jgi:hypothetical protein
MTRRVGGAALAAAALAALAGCPGRGSAGARPAPVELEWPDAAAGRVPVDAGVAAPVTSS